MTHLRYDTGETYCGKEGDSITIEEAMSNEHKPFDCVDCHKKLTEGKRHSEQS